MKFIPGEENDDVPEELIDSIQEGETLFLCGAGVSTRAGMPMFKGLTDSVYDAIGEDRNNEEAERVAYRRKEFDRVLHSLEQRTNASGSLSVRNAVTECLRVKNGRGSMKRHLSILRLSCGKGDRPRLLTTNFDILFERSAREAKDANLKSVPSHAGKAIPKPGGDQDYGIMHLHGRIEDSDYEGSELVLTSADFGDAYLRDGWASRYIEDRLRMEHLLLIGYSAEDVAMRLLLETLNTDRKRFPDLKKVYAMDKFSREKHKAKSIWKSKGIELIGFKRYDDIYRTLKEMADYIAKPTNYSIKKIQQILQPGP